MSKRNLLGFSKNIYSQFGEDGILREIFRHVGKGKENRWCVEFGAWDGIEFSNTRHLIKDLGWHGVLIEPVARRFRDLVKNNEGNSKVIPIRKFVDFKGKGSLDNILSKTEIPSDFDLLSIDIDGNDYHVWESVKKYHPKVVVIEINSTIPSEIEFVQPKDFKVNQGSSLLSLYNLGKTKGYELVACTDGNAIFVLRKYFHLFNIDDNSPEKMLPKEHITQFFQLFDGTIVLRGCKRLLWHGIDFSDDDFQIIPKYMRRFPNKLTIVIVKILQGDWKTLSTIILHFFRK